MPFLTHVSFAVAGSAAALPVLLIITCNVALVRWLSRGDGKWRWELLGLLTVQATAAWLVASFFVGFNIGAGDCYCYSLQLADFLTQVRHGVYPVFVGQSEWAFNGNIQTVRTAHTSCTSVACSTCSPVDD